MQKKKFMVISVFYQNALIFLNFNSAVKIVSKDILYKKKRNKISYFWMLKVLWKFYVIFSVIL